ncbi:MAG: element excision factor XisH family protein [Bacteroidota bacterium]
MAKDYYHEIVKAAIIDDGWTITDDPYTFDEEVDAGRGLQIDLGAERLIAANRGIEKVAIEVKSFLGTSISYQFHQAIGQYINYRAGLLLQEPERKLYLAIPQEVYDELQLIPVFKLACTENAIKFLVYNLSTDKVVSWID